MDKPRIIFQGEIMNRESRAVLSWIEPLTGQFVPVLKVEVAAIDAMGAPCWRAAEDEAETQARYKHAMARIVASLTTGNEAPVPLSEVVDNSHEAMTRRGKLHALLSEALGLYKHPVVSQAFAFGSCCVELCASHGIEEVSAMLAIVAEEHVP